MTQKTEDLSRQYVPVISETGELSTKRLFDHYGTNRWYGQETATPVKIMTEVSESSNAPLFNQHNADRWYGQTSV